MSEKSLDAAASNDIPNYEDNGQDIENLFEVENEEHKEEIFEIPSETKNNEFGEGITQIPSDTYNVDNDEMMQNISEDNEGEEKEIKEVNLEDEEFIMEVILDHNTSPDPDSTSINDSEFYYSQSYEESQQNIDHFLEEFENEEEEEIEVAVRSMYEPSLNSESQEEFYKESEKRTKMDSRNVSESLPTTEMPIPSDEQERDVSGLDSETLTPDVELQDDTRYKQEIEKEQIRNAERILLICDELGPILDIIVVIEGQETLRTSFGINSLISNVKIRLAPIFHLKPNEINLLYEERICQDGSKLSDFGVVPPSTMVLQVKAKDEHDILSNDYLHYAPLIDIISVKIPRNGNYFEKKLMQIESDCFVKEWLGGFKNKRTNKEYHNVQTQTLPRIYNLPPGVALPQRFTRQSQTPVFPLVDEGTEPPESKSTQVWRTDFYVPNCSDKIMIGKPGRFKRCGSNRSFMQLSTIVHAVVVFNRFIKRLKKKMCKRQKDFISLPHLETMNLKMKDEITREVQRKMIINMFFPTTRYDFAMVYLLVSKWRYKETKLIDKLKTNESRKAAYCSLFKKEVDMIWTIEKQRLAVKEEALKRNNQQFIEKTARLKNTKHFIPVDSLETQQARDYMEIYSTLTRRDVTVEQRLDILHHFRNIILSILSEEGADKLVKLVDRECDLLQIGVKPSQIEVLRLRIQQHTLECLHTNLTQPDTNNSYKERKLKKSVQAKFRCSRCRLLKPCIDYNVHIKVTKFSVCYSCEWLMHIGYQRLDLSPYLRILESVRKSEMTLHTTSAVSYILQVTGMYFLVNNIWLGKSALSENSDVSILRMVRWKQDEDWTPWNCILLTQEEARIHMDIADVDEYYAKPFLDSVYLKHKRTRYHFLLLYMSDVYIKKTGLWYNVI